MLLLSVVAALLLSVVVSVVVVVLFVAEAEGDGRCIPAQVAEGIGSSTLIEDVLRGLDSSVPESRYGMSPLTLSTTTEPSCRTKYGGRPREPNQTKSNLSSRQCFPTDINANPSLKM